MSEDQPRNDTNGSSDRPPEPAIDATKTMLQRFIATDRGFTRAKRQYRPTTALS